MNTSDRIRLLSPWVVMALLFFATTVHAVGHQCSPTDITILNSTLDRTEARIDFSDATIEQPIFPLAITTPERPTVRILEVDGVILDPPYETGTTIQMLVPPGRARDMWLFDIQSWRLRFTVTTTLGYEGDSVRFEVLHPARPDLLARIAERASLARRGVAPEPLDPALDALAGSVINTAVARQILAVAQPELITAGIDDVFARATRWLRLEVEEGGLHRFDYASLRSALGDDVDLIDPSSLRIFGARHRMQPEDPQVETGSWNAGSPWIERPLRVSAAGASFGPADFVEAFLPGVRGWSDEFDPSAPPLAQDEVQTADRISYWLTWDEIGGIDADFVTAPRRMATRSAASFGADRVLRDVRTRSHFEENSFPAFGLVEDDWAWRTGILQGEFARFDVQFASIVADSISYLRTRPRMNRPTQGDGSFPAYEANYLVNGEQVAERSWNTRDQRNQNLSLLPLVHVPVPLRPGANEIIVQNTTQRVGPNLYIDALGFTWRRSLDVGAGRFEWFVPAAEATNERWRYEFRDPAGRLVDARVFDVTDAWNPIELTGLVVTDEGRAMSLEVDLVAGQVRRFAFALEDQFRDAVNVERERPRRLRAEVANEDGTPAEGWHMVVLYPEIFQSAAEDVAALRRQTLGTSRVTAVSLQDVYDQFGHGGKDPGAIRNYFKFLFEVDRDFLYVLLVGDTNRDARGVLAATDPDFCPTYVEDFWPAEGPSSWEYLFTPFGRDDWFVSFHTNPNPSSQPFGNGLDIPDAAIGRLPVTTVAEASGFVQRLRDYEFDPEPGPWRNRVVLAADDTFGKAYNNPREDEHILEAECVAESVLPSALDVEKIYLTEFDRTTPSSANKPGARRAFRDAWSEGALIVHYIGHGSPTQMADEVVFRIEDVPTLTNGARLPVFLAFSCDVAIYDDPTVRSMSEQMVLQDRGGAIAAIAASQVTYSRYNELLTEAFYTRLYPDPAFDFRFPSDRLTRSEPIGLALVAAKWSSPYQQVGSQAGQNNAKYVVLGDPAMRLRSPEESIELGGELAQAMRSGQELDLLATLPDGSIADRWYVRVGESAERVRFGYPTADPDTVLVYDLDGATFFDGTGSTSTSQVALDVRTPAVMRFGDRGRLQVLMEVGAEQYVGVIDTLDVIRAPVDSDDGVGPSITLDFAQGARRVQPGSVLVATIEDPSGVNTLGTTPANSILYEVGDGGLSVDVTEEFSLEEGSTTRGMVEVPLTEVEPGDYVLRMTASDMLGNNSAAEIAFEVVPGGVAEIGNHAPVPNPTLRGDTQFVVDVVSPVGLSSSVEIDIRTVDGAPVRTLRSDVSGGGGRVVVPWDGRDRRGDEVANGTYLYVVRARFATSPPVTETSTGRVVVMR